MAHVLVIESSARKQGSISRQLTEAFVANWLREHPLDRLVRRDLAEQPLPHLDEDLLMSWMSPAEQLSAVQREALKRSNDLIEELKQADVLVIAAPMYNFGIPSTLKAWFDHVLRAGVTFKYTEQGPVGLLQGKRAFILTARGGIHSGGPSDHQDPHLRQLLGFIGIDQVRSVHAEGLNLGDQAHQQGLTKAMTHLAELAV